MEPVCFKPLYIYKKNFDQKQKIHFVSKSLGGKCLLWLLSNEKCKSLSLKKKTEVQNTLTEISIII